MLMLPATPPTDHSKLMIQEAILAHASASRSIGLVRDEWVYKSGDRDTSIYLVRSGQVRLQVPVSGGRDCFLDICRTGDVFGESCLSGNPSRLESAIAAEETNLIQVDQTSFVQSLNLELKLEYMVRLMAVRALRHEALIGLMRMKDEGLRLVMALLHLCSIYGADGAGTWSIEQGALQDHLAPMVRMGPDRVGLFLEKFCALDLIGLTADQSVAIREDRLRDFAARGASVDDEDGYQESTSGSASLYGALMKSDETNASILPGGRIGMATFARSSFVH